MKKAISAFLTLVLFLCLVPGAHALVEQSDSFYVADYANVLSQDTEDWIINSNAQLEQQCKGAQIVVVTVDYLGGMYADEYAYELFNDWGVGSAAENNGMLLLLAVQENKAWLAYGLGLHMEAISGSRPVNIADELLEEYFWDDFDRGDYDTAVQKLFAQLVEYYASKYMVRLDVGQKQYIENYGGNSGTSAAIKTLIWLVVLIVVLTILFRRPRRRYRSSGFGTGFGMGALMGSRRRRTPPPPPPPAPPRPQPPPPRNTYRAPMPPPAAPKRPSTPPPRPSSPRPSSPPRSSSRTVGGINRAGGAGRGGRPGGGGGMGRGGGGFSGGGAGRR